MSLMQHYLLKHSLRGLTVLSALSVSVPAAAYFYTIIGPDGHPIVVQQKQAPKKQPPPQPLQPQQPVQKADTPPPQVLQPQQSMPKAKTPAVQAVPPPPVQLQSPTAKQLQPPLPRVQQAPAPVLTAPLQQQPIQKADTPLIQKTDTPPPQLLQQQPIQKNKAPAAATVSSPLQAVIEKTPAKPIQITATPAPISSPRPQPVSILAPQHSRESSPVMPADAMIDAGQHVILSASPTKTAAVDPNQEKNFTEIDGERYVDAEYLEQREFNLEGKKRFYVMPEVDGSGSQRMQTVEREKGITASILGTWRHKDPLADLPKALAPQYQRMPKQQLVDVLEQSCFKGKKIDNAKILSAKNRDIGFWPMAPLNDSFGYEVARIDASVEEILLSSYASSQKIPTYYWPLVVFLDQQGCVLEGVSGFKNQYSDQSKFQHASLQGVLKKPQAAVYLLMTPLASAMDIEASQLSNQGQFKLSVIR